MMVRLLGVALLGGVLAACGGGGGSGGGGSAGGGGGEGPGNITTSPLFNGPEGAAMAALGVGSIIGMALEQSDPEGIATKTPGADGMSSNTRSIQRSDDGLDCDSGSYQSTQGSSFSFYANEDIITDKVIAENCKIKGDNIQISTNGMMEVGEADDGKIVLAKYSDTDGSIDGGYYATHMTGGGSPLGEMKIKMRGHMDICDGCNKNPGGIAMEVYLDAYMKMGGEEFAYRIGDSHERMKMNEKKVSATQSELDINGSFAFWTSDQCSFAATYKTVSAIIIEDDGSEDGDPVGGEIDVSLDTGGTYKIKFQSDKSVIVNDERYTADNLQDIASTCGIDDSDN
jgi:hypothetical protein